MKFSILLLLCSGIFTNRLVTQTSEKISTLSLGDQPSSENQIELDCLIKQEASFIKLNVKQILKISNAEKVNFSLPESVDAGRAHVFVKIEMSRKEDEKVEVFVSLIEEKEETQAFLLARIERVSGQVFTSLSVEIPSVYSDQTPKLIRATLPQSSKKLFDYQISYLKTPKKSSSNFRILEDNVNDVSGFIDSIKDKILKFSDEILPEKIENLEKSIEKIKEMEKSIVKIGGENSEQSVKAFQTPESSNGFTLSTNQEGFARKTKLVNEIPEQLSFELPTGLKGFVLEGQMVSFAVNLQGKEIELEENENGVKALFAQILLV